MKTMPLKISDLQPGDRVMLFCPKSRIQPKREAIFEQVHAFDDQSICASFLMQTVQHGDGQLELRGVFEVEPDGITLRDDTGRRIYVEQRVFAGRG